MLDNWEEALGRLDLNPYESAALRTALEAMESLIHARDEVDRIRGHVNRADGSTQWYKPTTYQQKQLFRAVSSFFDAYYTAVSTWSGVVARFSSVFGRNFSDNKPFLDWFRDAFPEQPLAYTELERARLFRALLSHPQQFPVYSWATYAAQVDPLLRIVVWGPAGRGTRRMPEGAVDNHPGAEQFGDWQFEAPDEVSVTNSVGILGVAILATILSRRTQGSAFARPISFERAIEILEPDMDVSEAARGWHRISDLLGN